MLMLRPATGSSILAIVAYTISGPLENWMQSIGS
jgi:hypothetical protein